jgi:hypothetical protein
MVLALGSFQRDCTSSTQLHVSIRHLAASGLPFSALDELLYPDTGLFSTGSVPSELFSSGFRRLEYLMGRYR